MNDAAASETLLTIDNDGDTMECTLTEFLADNAEGLDDGDRAAIVGLNVGETFRGGGGAGGEWSVTRKA